MQKLLIILISLLIILISLLIIGFTFLEVKASESELNLETKNKIESIINNYTHKVAKKYNEKQQISIYEKFNTRITKMQEGINGEKLLIINYIGELINLEIKNINELNMNNIIINQGENKNIDDILSIEYVDIDLPEGKNGYAGIQLKLQLNLDIQEINLDLDTKNETIIWKGYKIIILNVELYSPVTISVEKIEILTDDISKIRVKLLNFKDYQVEEINNTLLELNKLEEPSIYSESLIDPDGSYHTYIESTYVDNGLKIHQYDGIVTNVEENKK